jgi:hypothetical protein
MDLDTSFRKMHQKAIGTGNGTIVGLVSELVKVLQYLDKEIKSICANPEATMAESGPTTDVHVPVLDVPKELQHVPTREEMSKPVVSESEGDSTKRAKKGTTGKAKKTTKRSI